MLAHIDNVTNAVVLNGYPIGDILLSGPGAGESPTTSYVMGDILSIARAWKTTDYLLPMMRCHHHSVANPINIENTYNKYYLSISAPNAIGLIAKIGTSCANKNISLASILSDADEETARITVITDKCLEKDLRDMIAGLDNCIVKSLIRVMEG